MILDKVKQFFRPTSWESESLINLLLLFISVTLPLVALEVYLNYVHYPFDQCQKIVTSAEFYLGQFDKQTGWSYKPQISYFDHDRRLEYHFNKDGIRVETQNKDIDFSKPRIVFIGDSVTFGEELNFDDTFAVQINKLLQNKFEVVNLGVQGFGTDQAMLRLEKFIKEINPEVVVYTFIQDDKNRNINYDRRLHVKCFEFAGTKPLFAMENDGLRLVRLPKKYDDVDRYKLPLFFSHSWQNFREQLMEKNEDDIRLTAALINRIQETIIINHARDYYIYYDRDYDPNPNNYNSYLSSQIFTPDQLKRTLMFTNWAVDSSKKGVKYFVNENDDIHPNASLSAQIAKKFVEQFGEQLLKD